MRGFRIGHPSTRRLVSQAGSYALTGQASSLVAGGGGGDPTSIVPAVTAGLEVDTALPTLPSPWTTSTTGFYYVKQGGSAVNNGTPAAPRGTIPNPIPAGAVVVLDNSATLAVSSQTLSFSGTSGSRSWFLSSGYVGYGTADTKALMTFTGSVTVSGSYGYIHGIDFNSTSTSSGGVDLSTINNFLIRTSNIRGNAVQRASNASGFTFNGTSGATRLNNVVLYDVEVRDWGLWNPSSMAGDIDVHGIQFGRYNEDVWILNSRFFHNQGDGIQFTTNGAPPIDDVRRVYVQDCTFYENLQNGWWHKFGDSLVFARNTVYNHKQNPALTGGGSADSLGCGGQYDFNNVWYIRNRFYDNDGAIRFASASSGVAGQNIYIIGNVVSNADATENLQSASPNSWGTPFSLWQGVNIYVIGNTLDGYTGHGIGCTPNSGLNLRVESNILQGRNSASFYDIFLESYTTAPKIKNNSFPASPRFNMNGVTTTSVSALQSADSTNRQNNISGAVSFTSAVTSGLGDYSVQAGDATVDAGDVISDVYATYLTNFGVDIRKDFDGNARPVANADWDIGAYERAA